MKIVALNFGRAKAQTMGYLDQAVRAAEAAGAEVEVIQMINKKIGRCLGCGACSGGVAKGKTNAPFCVLKDDLREIAEKVLDADGILVGAPVYVLAPPGQFFDFVHRFGVAADKSVMMLRDAQRKRDGQEPVDPRFLKKQWVGFISVGGCRFHHWVSFGLPGMNTFAFPTNMKVVGAVDIHGAWGESPRQEFFMDQCRQLGENLVESIGKEDQKIRWIGRQGHCPACHGDIFSVIPGTRKVECPVCGITGELDIVDGELQVAFTEEAIFHSRMNLGGIIDHCVELHGNEDPLAMEMFGDVTWAKPRNFAEEMKEIMEFEKEVLEQ